MPTVSPTPVNITFGINDLKLIRFELKDIVKKIEKQIDFAKYEFRFSMSATIREAQQLYEVAMVITLQEKQSSNTYIELAELEALLAYRIENFPEALPKTAPGNDFILSEGLVATTAGIAVSTARGLFHMCVKDTILSNAIVPIINPSLFIPEQLRTQQRQ